MAAYAGLNAIDTRRLVNHVDSYWDLTSGLNDNKILSQVCVSFALCWRLGIE